MPRGDRPPAPGRTRPRTTGQARATRWPTAISQSSQRRRSDQEQDGRARRLSRLLALGLAACGSSSTSSSLQLELRPPPAAHPATISGAGSTFAAPGLRTVGIVAQSGLTVNYQAVGSGAGHHRAREQDRRLRRQRPAAEAGRRSSDRQERQPRGADPDVPGRDHDLLQPARRQDRHEARRQDDRRHLPRQGQDLERRRDQGAEPGHQPAEHGDHGDPPLGLLGHDLRLHQLPVRRSTPNGRARSAKARPCSGRQAPGPRATPASPARSSRRPAPSATSSRHTRSRTTSRSRR